MASQVMLGHSSSDGAKITQYFRSSRLNLSDFGDDLAVQLT